MLICYGGYITQEFLSFFCNVNRSAIRRRFAIIPGSHHHLALCRECQLRVECGGSARSPLKRLCPLKRTSRSAATGTPISCILIGLTYRIHKPLFSFAEKTVQNLTLCGTITHRIKLQSFCLASGAFSAPV